MDSKTDLAQQRTDFAEDRTALANERTFAGWLRTGYAGIAIGLAFNALFSRVSVEWVPKAIATAFLLIAILIFVLAERRASDVLSRLHTHRVETVRSRSVRWISRTSILATVALIASIWLLEFEKLAP